MRLFALLLLTAPAIAQVDEVPETPRATKTAFAQLHLEWGAVPDQSLVRFAARQAVEHDPAAAFSVAFTQSALATLALLRVPSGHETPATDFDGGLAQLVGALEMHQALSRAFGVQSLAAQPLDALLDEPFTQPRADADTEALRAFAGEAWASPAYLRACARWLGHVRERAACVQPGSVQHARAVQLSQAARALMIVAYAGLALVDPPQLAVPPDELDEPTATDTLVRELLLDGTPEALERIDALAHSSVRAEQVAGARGLLQHGYRALAAGDTGTAARHGLDCYLSGIPHRLRYRALVLYCLSGPPNDVQARLEAIGDGALDTFLVPHLAELRALAKLSWC